MEGKTFEDWLHEDVHDLEDKKYKESFEAYGRRRIKAVELDVLKEARKKNKDLLISVIGLGPVGVAFTVAALNAGCTIYGYDYSFERITFLNSVANEKTILKEDRNAGLLLKTNKDRLHLSTEYDDALAGSEIKIICVGTDQVYKTITDLSPYLNQNDIVIIESTLFVPMIDEVVETFKSVGLDPTFDIKLAIVPERIMEGRFLKNFVEYTKTIGSISPETFYPVSAVYKKLGCETAGPYPPKWVVALKAFENATRYSFIAIANMFADIAKKEGIDHTSLIEAMINLRPDMPIMRSGIGIGGPCIPMAAKKIAEDYPSESFPLTSLIEREKKRQKEISDEIISILQNNNIAPDKVAIFGATYRANGVDKRESPAMEIIKHIKRAGYNVAVYDPNWKIEPYDEIVVLNNSVDHLMDDYDAFIVLVGHNEYVDAKFPKTKIFINLVGSMVSAHPESRHYRLYK